MTTSYFLCTHELYRKNKLLCSTAKSHLSTISSIKNVFKTLFPELALIWTTFFSSNCIIKFQICISCRFSKNLLVFISIQIWCAWMYFITDILMDPKRDLIKLVRKQLLLQSTREHILSQRNLSLFYLKDLEHKSCEE